MGKKNEPHYQTYISWSGGLCRLIHQGMQLCADSKSDYMARKTAEQMKVELPPVHWDGDQGQFVA